MGGGGDACRRVPKMCTEGWRRAWLQGIALREAYSEGKEGTRGSTVRVVLFQLKK